VLTETAAQQDFVVDTASEGARVWLNQPVQRCGKDAVLAVAELTWRAPPPRLGCWVVLRTVSGLLQQSLVLAVFPN
jgi:hypothetical protein